ncbi:MAG: hypothetical protein HOB32_03420 [Nitrospina sp.]|jgi:hypothetical protein|nr:hypothetical protein [Nitrospina sp.]MBT6600701.1 hypothetical protein [Nitrospina sp.]
MATLDQLKTHIKKAKTEFSEAAKKAEDNKYDLVSRQKKKKIKRLKRKVAKITATEKMAEQKKKPKKERKSASEG